MYINKVIKHTNENVCWYKIVNKKSNFVKSYNFFLTFERIFKPFSFRYCRILTRYQYYVRRLYAYNSRIRMKNLEKWVRMKFWEIWLTRLHICLQKTKIPFEHILKKAQHVFLILCEKRIFLFLFMILSIALLNLCKWKKGVC